MNIEEQRGASPSTSSNRARSAEGFSREEIHAYQQVHNKFLTTDPSLAESLASIEGKVLLAKDANGKNVLSHLHDVVSPPSTIGLGEFPLPRL